VLILVYKLQILLKKQDLKIVLPVYHSVKVKENLPKELLKELWLKENGSCYKTVIWPHHLCLNFKEFWKMQHKFTETLESG
jgi:hypothetical protein